ncbi:acetyl-CoA/propionyl-CoA carboxylase [Capronia coronata CBS 617.96]|uniref:Acetyl-CoA/propionyl-CoA carboxylase n=1 Tax=Capronia coronata CBS 617.96 TaxID=1182541 RepID=W9XJS8_9EURO|nr:acetyl-CoA/propionyl-CoA carboxylase [Capronia coronata CBS 617.96]EXJ80438.1 acetyl-CoA/propionyl-CoA carboxylase [Capronia coronata CBS 617.96]
MESLRTVLVSNRGEIAVRLIRSAKSIGIRTIAIYTEPDAPSAHVSLADTAVLLKGSPATAYLDSDQIISIAKTNGADAVIPGYGFLSENADFARKLREHGLAFVGPSPEHIESFGLKHSAIKLAIEAGVPVVPGSNGLLDDEERAVSMAQRLGFPVMLKATAGGGGMGLLTCFTEDEVRSSFQTVRSRGEALFKNAGLFLERYYPSSHHIEVQIFGNGQGKAISVGERECSIQRRHQKVIEECPSPYIENRHPELREQLTAAAISLAETVQYASAGTVEFLVDDATGSFFFLEMNTRLQVEHGITELCYGVDLVELMYRQADAELSGRGGLDTAELVRSQPALLQPQGNAIELRVYAENPARNFAPSPGVLQEVRWHEAPGQRIDSWVRTGITISSYYDPLLAKVMHHSSTRAQAIQQISDVVTKSVVSGPANNLDFLLAILQSTEFGLGNTTTKFLDTFDYFPPAIDVISGGSLTLIQDYPGRPTIGRGFGHAGPMDPIAFQIGNALVGNELGLEALEVTLNGPELLFLGDAVVALCGAPFHATLNGKAINMWTRLVIHAGDTLRIGKAASDSGCRAYLAVKGGFPNVAPWFGSKATCPGSGVGGYQGRSLKSGDYLRISPQGDLPAPDDGVCIPAPLIPRYSQHWDVQAMAGPYEEGYLSAKDIEMLYNTTWKISHNAARGGIRLIGPSPEWARLDGGDGGAHPSNVVEYGYPLGGLNWTGDEPVIFPVDCPDFGGFICSLTVIKADLWKVGQLEAGNTLRFHKVTLEQALRSRRRGDHFVQQISAGVKSGSFKDIEPLDNTSPPLQDLAASTPDATLLSVVRELSPVPGRPAVTYRQGGDQFLLVDYGNESFDINKKCRATALQRLLRASVGDISFQGGLINAVGCGNSLQIYYDGLRIPQRNLVEFLVRAEERLGDLHDVRLLNRTFRLPLTFTHPKLKDCVERYMTNQRPYATYLPDNFDFVAWNNGLDASGLKRIFLEAQFVVVGVGFISALPQCLPADPRHRLKSPKMNPSRTFTPEGTVSWGGSCMALYNADSPGGYMVTGMTIPGVDVLGYKAGYSASRPWLFEDMDVITFYEVTEGEYDDHMSMFRRGLYQYDMVDTNFDMKAHNQLLDSVKDELQILDAYRSACQEKVLAEEKALVARWTREKDESAIPMDFVDSWLKDPEITAIEAPVNANVWKVLAKEGDILVADQTMVILEAMKLEINVDVAHHLAGARVEKVLVKPADVVDSGKPLLLLRVPSQ